MREKLMPCPFCGGEARIEIYGGTACAVVCQSCRCGTPTMSLVDGVAAVNRWNLRADLIEPQEITGETSDGYHTFDELYDHCAKLFSVIVRDHRELAWKSRLHHDGTMYDGMFIVGIETPGGQATYHYDVDPYWDLFDCKELDRAPRVGRPHAASGHRPNCGAGAELRPRRAAGADGEVM